MRFRDDYTHDIRKHLVSGGILLRGDPAASLCGNCPGLCHRGIVVAFMGGPAVALVSRAGYA